MQTTTIITKAVRSLRRAAKLFPVTSQNTIPIADLSIERKNDHKVMPSALFLLKSGNGREKMILKEISRMTGVTCAYSVVGYYDVVVIAQAYTEYELKWTIANKIKHLDGVTSFVALLERSQESVAASA